MTDPAAPQLISRSMSDEPVWAERAADLIRQADGLVGLSALDAHTIVSYTRLLRCAEGQVLTREGEPAGDGFMLLVLSGEVTVETVVARRDAPVVVSVAGPGHLIGETALLDGGPRTATCTATAPVIGAGLSRNALQRMMRAEPEVAARLLAGVAQRMAQRLRDLTRQQRVYHQLLGAMQGEVDELQRQLQQVMDGAARRSAQRGTDAA